MCEAEDKHPGPSHDSPPRHLNRGGGKKEKVEDQGNEANESADK